VTRVPVRKPTCKLFAIRYAAKVLAFHILLLWQMMLCWIMSLVSTDWIGSDHPPHQHINTHQQTPQRRSKEQQLSTGSVPAHPKETGEDSHSGTPQQTTTKTEAKLFWIHISVHISIHISNTFEDTSSHPLTHHDDSSCRYRLDGTVSSPYGSCGLSDPNVSCRVSSSPTRLFRVVECFQFAPAESHGHHH
jgi:hypothetical protein